MNRKPSNSDVYNAVASAVAAIEVPRFDMAAIEARRKAPVSVPAAKPWSLTRRALVVALPVVLVLAVVLPTMPSVVAQVQRALAAFAVINGQTVPLSVRSVSLEQARAQMPFTVIPPAAVPPGLKLTINELYSESAPADARLVFEFHGTGAAPVLTISESPASAHGPTKLMVTERRVVGNPGSVPAPAGAPPLGPDESSKSAYVMRQVEVKNVNGHVTKQVVELHPIAWVAHGTRIVLAAAPGNLSPQQVDAIRAAMSR